MLIGILAATAAPRFLDLSSDAKIAALNGIKSELQATITLAQAKARVSGLRPAAANPGGSLQTGYIVDFGFGSTEVDWRNLCPESRAEAGDQLEMLDFINISGDDLESRVTNQHTLFGYDVPAAGTPTNQGCYILYDSFGNPECTLQVVTADC
ncbi:pilus assembly FimT family protein [Alteromonas facilis]|uniref:pilus assembly FimT family protein n=1 Tax=Alteromonas facilis TaxID=2048004 RepID=UPI001F0CA06E|nr:prepilin-type cleavage/methylation domain-containing protein [Alteromonas facilis]